MSISVVAIVVGKCVILGDGDPSESIAHVTRLSAKRPTALPEAFVVLWESQPLGQPRLI